MENQYVVSVCYSAMPLPYTPFVHCWIEITCNEVRDRYDLLSPASQQNKQARVVGHVFRNFLPLDKGLVVFPQKNRANLKSMRFNRVVYSSIQGAKDSAAHKIALFVEKGGLYDYPYAQQYNMVLGPNSNYFAQWIANMDNTETLRLPWNAWGKNYEE